MSGKKVDPLLLVRENIRSLAPYSTARDEYTGPLGIYLDANENPYDNGYNRYPDPYQKKLKERLSHMRGVAPESIFIGNGSDEGIDLAYRVFCVPGRDNAVSITPTYGMYKVAAAINDVEFREVPLGDDFGLDVDALLAAADGNTKLMFVCSPNNPSGNSFPQEDIERLLDSFSGMLVLDEAYIEFSEQGSMLGKLSGYPNLIVLQTLSKAWGMAGLRFGMAFAAPEVIGLFTKVKYPYNINGLTQKVVLEQLGRNMSTQLGEILSERAMLLTALAKVPAVRKVWPSDANFILTEFDDPRGVYDKLIAGGIIVRDRSHIRGCGGCLRITVGSPLENKKMLNILNGLCKNGNS